jgi:hypothetical protein
MMTHRPRRPRYENDYEYNDRPRRREKPSMFSGISGAIDGISLDWMLGIGSFAIVADACLSRDLVSYCLGAAWIVFCGVVLIVTDKTIDRPESKFRGFLKRYGSTGIWGIVFGVVALTALSLVLADPSHAAEFFMSKAEKAITTAIVGTRADDSTAAVKNLITMIFGALRMFIIIALATGIYKVIAARDDSEDMKAQARLPILVLISVAAFDIMSALIVG